MVLFMQKDEVRGRQMVSFGKSSDKKINRDSRDKDFYTTDRLYEKKQNHDANKERQYNRIYSKRPDNVISNRSNRFHGTDQGYKKNQNNWIRIAEKKTSDLEKLHDGFYKPNEIPIDGYLIQLQRHLKNPQQGVNKVENDLLNSQSHVKALMRNLGDLIKNSAPSEFYINEILKIMQQLILKEKYRLSVNFILESLLQRTVLSNDQIYKIVTMAITGKDDRLVQKSSSRVLENLAQKQKLPENIINAFLAMVVKDLAIQKQLAQNIVNNVFDDLNCKPQWNSDELKEMLQNGEQLNLNQISFLLQRLSEGQELQEYQISLMLTMLENVSPEAVPMGYTLTALAKQPKLNETGINQVLKTTQKLAPASASFVLEVLAKHPKLSFEQINHIFTMIDKLALASKSFVLQPLVKHQKLKLSPDQISHILTETDKLDFKAKGYVFQDLAECQELSPDQINDIFIKIINEYNIAQKQEGFILIEKLVLNQKFQEYQINAFLKMIFDVLFPQNLLNKNIKQHISDKFDKLSKAGYLDTNILNLMLVIRGNLRLDTVDISYLLASLIKGQQLQEYQINLILIMIPGIEKKAKGSVLQILAEEHELTGNQIESIINMVNSLNEEQISYVLKALIDQNALKTDHIDQILHKIALINSLKTKTFALLDLIKSKILQGQQITGILNMIKNSLDQVTLKKFNNIDNTTQSGDIRAQKLAWFLDNLIKTQELETKHIDKILDIIWKSHPKQQFSNILINLVNGNKVTTSKQIDHVLRIAYEFKEKEVVDLLKYLIGNYRLSEGPIDEILKFCLGYRPVINDFKSVKFILGLLFDTKDLILTTKQVNTISNRIIPQFADQESNELSRMLIAYQQKLLNQQKSREDFEMLSDSNELNEDIANYDSEVNKINRIFTKEKELAAEAKQISEKQTNLRFSKKEQTGLSASDLLNFFAKERQKMINENEEDFGPRSKQNMLISANDKTVNILSTTKQIVTGLEQSSKNKSYSLVNSYQSENDYELNKSEYEDMSENESEQIIKMEKSRIKINTDLKCESLFSRFKRKRNARDVGKQEPIPKQSQISNQYL